MRRKFVLVIIDDVIGIIKNSCRSQKGFEIKGRGRGSWRGDI